MTKHNLLLGFSYAAIWFGLTTLIFQFGFEFPMSWTQSILENPHLSESLKILSIRALWSVEFALHILLAAIPSSYLIVKFSTDISFKTIAKTSLISLVFLSAFLLAVMPKYVPFYFALLYVTISFVYILYGCVRCMRYITSQ